MFQNSFGNSTVDFSNPKAVKALNTALLKCYYQINYWTFDDVHLCPPIPSRVTYIHLLHDLLSTSGIQNEITVLDIGTGATCIYPLLGYASFGWRFIASEIDLNAFKNSQHILTKNALDSYIALRFQNNPQDILTGILNPSEMISAAMCNPPFYKSEAEAKANTVRKLKGLGQSTDTVTRNFSGTATELYYSGGEKAFLHNYLYQSSLLKTNCFWYTSLVSNKANVASMQSSLKTLGATSIKVLDFTIGHKKSRIVAWTFLTSEAQNAWISKTNV